MKPVNYAKFLLKSLPRVDSKSNYYSWIVLANIMIGTFMAVLDATIVNVGLTSMKNSFGTSIDKIEWVLTAYNLIFAVILPCSGWIADHFGYKRTYFLGLFLFTLGSFLCGLAWNENILIAFRIIQGCGGGLLMPVGLATITREFPPEKRGVALGFWGIAAAASVSLGPMIGGYLIDNYSWHAIFNVNVPVGIVGLLATVIIQKEYRTEDIRSFDFVGFISVVVFLTFLLLALASGNSSWNTGGWTSEFIITCFALSAVGFIVFLYTELTVKHPMIDLRLLKDKNFLVTNIILFIFGFGLFGSTFLLPYYLENSLGYTALQAGLVFLPIGILQMVMSPISGTLSDRINPKIPAAIGIFLLAVGLYLNSFLSLHSEHSQVMLPLYIRGLAMGLLFTPLTSMALMTIPVNKMAQASGLLNVLRQIGASFGVAVLNTILNSQTVYHMAIYGQSVNDSHSPVFQRVFYRLFFHSMAAGQNSVDSSSQAGALIFSNIANQAFVQGICDDFLIVAVITLICLVPLFFIKIVKRKPGAGKHASME